MTSIALKHEGRNLSEAPYQISLVSGQGDQHWSSDDGKRSTDPTN